MKKRVGFIGMGNIGKPMARSVRRAGFPLAVYDIRPEPREELVSLGATACHSAAEVGRQSQVVIVMCRNYPQVEEAVLGPQGALEGLGPGSTLIVMSTITPQQVKQIAEQVVSKGVNLLDAPVSGGRLRAADGTLAIMVGGKAEVLEDCRPVLEAMGEYVYHVGEQPGDGQTVKTVNQIATYVNLVLCAEAMALGGKAGVDPKVVFEVVSHGTGDSWVFRRCVPPLIEGRYDAMGAALDTFLKDCDIVLDAGRQLSVPLPLMSITHQMLQMARVKFGPEGDGAMVIKLLQELAGVQVSEAAG